MGKILIACEESQAVTIKEIMHIYYMPPSKERSVIRSKTYKGIAEAMAEQWGKIIKES